MVFILLTGVAFIGLTCFMMTFLFMQKDLESLVPQVGIVLLATPLMIVFHELLHALGLLIVGVRRIHFGGSVKRFYFYVAAHDHLLNGYQYAFVALIPFVLMSVSMPLLLVFSFDYAVVWSTLLFFHSVFCAGDLGITNYIFFHGPGGMNIITDSKVGVTRFIFKEQKVEGS